jgi:hypothetical protein
MAPRRPQKQPPPEFVNELAGYLGRVVIAASHVEHALGITLAKMLKLNRLQHRSLVIPMSISNKIKLFRQLGNQYLSPQGRKTLIKMLDELKDCAELRNSLVHGFYGTKNGKFQLITHAGPGRFSGQPVSWTPKDLQALGKRINAATASVQQIRFLFPERLSLPTNRRPISPTVES